METPHLFSTTLLRWFDENGRQLPWRGFTDPYPIWISEVILQQTRIQQGWEYWERFMRRWPTVEQLADATEDEVLREWQGLGYYSRARNLHHAAKQVVEMGGFPKTFNGLRQLKGVGDYTAAAVASMAYGIPVAVVDGNVYRVLARYFGISTPINSTEGKKEFAALAQQLLPEKAAATFNQAIMDFGAVQCVPKSPRCDQCPLQETCVALGEKRVEDLPVKLRKVKVRERRFAYVYMRCNGETAIHRRGGRDIWQGLWEPLFVEGEAHHHMASLKSGDTLPISFEAVSEDAVTVGIADSSLNDGHSMNGRLTLVAKEVKHVLTHRILKADFFIYESDKRPSLPPDYIWIPESHIDQYAVPRLVVILLQML